MVNKCSLLNEAGYNMQIRLNLRSFYTEKYYSLKWESTQALTYPRNLTGAV